MWPGHATICQLLLEEGIDPNTTSDSGTTPLHQADANGHVTVAKQLLECGSDPNALDSSKQTPAARAEENNHLPLAKMLRSHETDYNEHEHGASDAIGPGQAEMLDSSVCKLLNISLESGFGQLLEVSSNSEDKSSQRVTDDLISPLHIGYWDPNRFKGKVIPPVYGQFHVIGANFGPCGADPATNLGLQLNPGA